MSETPAASADYSLRILWSLARWIEDTKGKEALAKVASDGGVEPADFDGSTRWVSHEQLESILASARRLAPDEETFKAAFAYRFKESYGAFRYMIWAVSLQGMAETAAKMSEKLFTSVGRFEILKSERNAFDFRYRSSRKESRLVCLSRHAPWTIGPTIWGLPPAELTEHACIGNGDEYCEYHLRWFDRSRIAPVFSGAAIGAVATVAVWLLQLPYLAAFAFVVLGGLAGHLLELRRTGAKNLEYAQSLNKVMRELGESEAETRSEIFALHQRQREWIRLMEQQVTERTTTLEKIVDGLDSLQQSRVSSIRGFSHDLRNPLFVVRGNAQFLRERIVTGEEGEALKDMEVAAAQIETMLSKLMEVATHDTGFVKLTPKPVVVQPLAEVFRRRLRALVHGRDIKVSVFCTREAPDEIMIDPLVFDRVVDNLLTNAAKYTDRGSILLEISGTPEGALAGPAINHAGRGGFLTLKLSDTGQGIPATQVERIFRPRPANEPSSPNSYGIGMSSVVRLLAQIGGRLDVMTKPEVGTTFWAHFPVAPAADHKRLAASDDNLESMITRVVTIRKVEGA